MAKSKSNSIDSQNSRKYGIPLYGASWVPSNVASTRHHEESKDESSTSVTNSTTQSYLVFAGGGGEGRSGIPNALLLALFEPSSNTLSDQPAAKLGTGADLPYRMAIHPGGEGVICSFPKSCKWFEFDSNNDTESHNLGLKLSEKVLTLLDDVGQQLALKFNNDGSVLAVGGEDGNLRVFKWPSMEVTLHEAQAHASVKDLDFSPDGRFLVSLGSGGPCRVWDVGSSIVVASLPRQDDEVFGFCRFAQNNNNQVLYVTAMQGQGGIIVTWNTTTWKRISSKRIVRDPISAFSVSADGKLISIGTIQGDIYIINSTSMQVQMVVRKAHLGLVTALMFAQDSRALVSASLDSSSRVTVIHEKKQKGLSLWVVLIILLALAVYFMKTPR